MDKVKADLEKAEARFTLQPGAKLDVSKVREAIKKAGYTPTWIAVTVTGALVAHDGGWAVKVKDSGQMIPLAENEALKKIQAAGVKGKPLKVTLRVPPGNDRAVVETFTIP